MKPPARTAQGERILCATEERVLELALVTLEAGQAARATYLLRSVMRGPEEARDELDAEVEAAARALDSMLGEWMRHLMNEGAIPAGAEASVRILLETPWEGRPDAARERARWFARRLLRVPDERVAPVVET